MMGRYFARFDESPTKKMKIGNNFVKEYWGEGSNRAKNWQRYDMGGSEALKFEEGVDSYVPYAGKMKDNLKPHTGQNNRHDVQLRSYHHSRFAEERQNHIGFLNQYRGRRSA